MSQDVHLGPLGRKLTLDVIVLRQLDGVGSRVAHWVVVVAC